MFKITRLGVLSVGKISVIINLFVGLIIGLIVTIFSVIGLSVLTSASGNASSLPPWALYSAIIIFPIFFGIFGFINGIIGALLFNLASKIGNGFDLEIEEIEEIQQSPRHSAQGMQTRQ